MKIIVPWSSEPLQVYAIAWSRFPHEADILGNRTIFSVADGGGLAEVYEHECEISSSDLNEFCIMPREFDARYLVLMWKPLADCGIWKDLREFDKPALKRFSEMRAANGH
ncbi:hypothetical protein, partial [Paracoccus spongiarum]